MLKHVKRSQVVHTNRYILHLFECIGSGFRPGGILWTVLRQDIVNELTFWNCFVVDIPNRKDKRLSLDNDKGILLHLDTSKDRQAEDDLWMI